MPLPERAAAKLIGAMNAADRAFAPALPEVQDAGAIERWRRGSMSLTLSIGRALSGAMHADVMPPGPANQTTAKLVMAQSLLNHAAQRMQWPVDDMDRLQGLLLKAQQHARITVHNGRSPDRVHALEHVPVDDPTCMVNTRRSATRCSARWSRSVRSRPPRRRRFGAISPPWLTSRCTTRR